MQAEHLGIDFDGNLALNFAVIERRWPAVASAVLHAEAPPLELLTPEASGAAEAGSFTARVEGLQLSSAYGRLVDAELQAERIPDGALRATVYGNGLGDLAGLLCQRRGLRELRVVILNPGLLRIAVALGDLTGWLEDKRIELVLGSGMRQPEEPFAAVTPELQLANDDCLALRDEVLAALQEPFVKANRAGQGKAIAAHILENESLVASDGDVASVFGRSAGKTGLVVGPGPTMADQIASLQTRRPGAELIVISTALGPVLAAGLVPDFVVMIDAFSVDIVANLDAEQKGILEKVVLVYAPCVQQATLRAWPGPRLAAYLRREEYAALNVRLPRGSLWTSGTVAHSAIDLAVNLGVNEVVMYGLDFAYPGGASHAPGTPDYLEKHGADQGRTIVNGFGERIASDPNLILYLRDLEGYVQLAKGVRFWRADRRAALVEGAGWLAE